MSILHRNWPFKLISLLLAFSLYVWVRRQEAVTQRNFLVRVQVPVPAGQELREPPTPPMVRVYLEGPAGKLESLREEDVRPVVRMEGYPPGERKKLPIYVERSGRAVDSDIETRVSPASLEVLTEARIERKLQVVIDTEGALPEGWDWAEPPRPDTDHTTVSGLKPVVDRVARVVGRVRPLNPQEQVAEWVPLEALDSSGAELQDHVTLDPKQVLVRGRLTRTVWSKQVLVQPIFTPPPGMRLRVTMEPKRVILYGSARALQEIHFVETPELDVPVGQARYFREVRLEVPAGITRVEPPTVRITIDQVGAR